MSTIKMIDHVTTMVNGLRMDKILKANASAEVEINKIVALLDGLKDYLPSAAKSRVLVLPDDPNDKNSFAIEAMAQAMGLRITAAEVPAEEGLTEAQKKFLDQHEVLHEMFSHKAVKFDDEPPTPYVQSPARSNVLPDTEKSTKAKKFVVRNGIRVSTVTGKPVRPYRRHKMS